MIEVTPTPEWTEDLPGYAYEAFTYTNVGGVVDVGVQYYRGEISGWYAAGMLGATALGGKAGGKAYQFVHKTVEMVDVTAKKSRYTNYSINVSASEARYNLEMNGYVSTNGIKYSNGYNHYNISDARTTTGNPGMSFYMGSRPTVKYDLIGM